MSNERSWSKRIKEPRAITPVTDDFLFRLATELDGEHVTAIVLTGSCARGEETAFSDIDFKQLVKEPVEGLQPKRYWREGRLVSVATGRIEQYRERLMVPEEAIFVVPGLRESRILIDKEGAFRTLQQEAENWTWEPLQDAANVYVSNLLVEYAEWVLKLLRAFLVRDELALSEMTLGIFSAATFAIVVQKGVLARSGNSYFPQAQEAAGLNSNWTRYHRLIAGVDVEASQELSVEKKGIVALHLYRETVQLLQSILLPLHRETLKQTISVVEDALFSE